MPISKRPVKRGLGRGFESLIPTDLLDESFDPTANQDQRVSELRMIKLSEIKPDPDQPRKIFKEQELNELAGSIREHGVLQPIIVSPFENGYRIVAGERRFRASGLAGLDKIPALVRTLNNQHRLEVSLIENLQRQDLNIMETATAYLKLRDQFNLTLEQIGSRVGGRSNSDISNKLRLFKLPKSVQEHLAKGELHEGQARPLIGQDEKIINAVIPKIISENWPAFKVEQFIVNLKKNRADDLPKSRQLVTNPYQGQLQKMRKHLKTDVNITSNSKGAGRITIKFKSQEEFDRLQKILAV